MHFQNISTDTKTLYRLNQNEQGVFFILNRSGDITFELTGPGATAHIFALYTGKDDSKQTLALTQKHLAPDTISSALIKSALDNQSTFSYNGTLLIAKNANGSDASQESRALLLSSEARAETRPALEILAHDVKCHHAATTAPLNEESLFFAESRGLSREKARELLVHGFFHEALERMETLGVETGELRERLNVVTG